MKFLSLLLLCISFAAHATVKDYFNIHEKILKDLPGQMLLPSGELLLKSKMKSSRDKTTYSSNPLVFHEGKEVSAINIRGALPRIILSEKEWANLSMDGKILLVLHEELSLMGFFDKDYVNSNAVYQRLKDGQNLSFDYFVKQVVSCHETYLNSISRVDVSRSFSEYYIRLSLYFSIANRCVSYIHKWKEWDWSVHEVAPDALTFAMNSIESASELKPITTALVASGASPIKGLDVRGLGLLYGIQGGQETNGGDGTIAEYLMIFESIYKNMPDKVVLDTGTVIYRSNLIKPSLVMASSYKEKWNQLTTLNKIELVLGDQLNTPDHSTYLAQRIFEGKVIERSDLIKSITNCRKDVVIARDLFEQISLVDLKRSFLETEMDDLLLLAGEQQCAAFVDLWRDLKLDVNNCPNPLNAVLTRGQDHAKAALITLKALLRAGADPAFKCMGEMQNCQAVDQGFIGEARQEMKMLLNCAE